MFKKAERKQAKGKIAIAGPSGAGKSYSALLLAKGIGGKIAALDTERGSLSLYSDLVDFDVVELAPPYTPERYIEIINEAEKAGYDTLIIDSLSHEWIGQGGLLEIHDKMPGNSYANWRKITPRHQALIDKMLNSKLHIIATMRSKTEYAQEEGANGKKTIKKLGMAPQQRDGMDYEFTLMLDVQRDSNVASADKDRTSLWANRFEVITEKHGEEIALWLNSGAKPEPRQWAKTEVKRMLTNAGIKDMEAFRQKMLDTFNHQFEGLDELSQAQLNKLAEEMQ